MPVDPKKFAEFLKGLNRNRGSGTAPEDQRAADRDAAQAEHDARLEAERKRMKAENANSPSDE